MKMGHHSGEGEDTQAQEGRAGTVREKIRVFSIYICTSFVTENVLSFPFSDIENRIHCTVCQGSA